MARTTFERPPRVIADALGEESFQYFEELHRIAFGAGLAEKGTLGANNVLPVETLRTDETDLTKVLMPDSSGTLHFVVPDDRLAQYLVLAADPNLDNERILTGGTNITVTDGGAGSTATVAVSPQGAGSSLDADTLDTREAAAFVWSITETVAATPLFGNVTVTGGTGITVNQVAQDLEIVLTGATGATAFVDNMFTIEDDGDSTKLLAFQCSGITTNTTRTMTVPDGDGTLLIHDGVAGGQTWTAGTGSGDDLKLKSTSHSTPGTIFLGSEERTHFEEEGAIPHNNPERLIVGSTNEPGVNLKGAVVGVVRPTGNIEATGLSMFNDKTTPGASTSSAIGLRAYMYSADGLDERLVYSGVTKYTDTTDEAEYVQHTVSLVQEGSTLPVLILDNEGMESNVYDWSGTADQEIVGSNIYVQAKNTSGGAVGLGVMAHWSLENAAQAEEAAAGILTRWTDVTAGTEYAEMVFSTMTNGSLSDVMNIRNDHVHIGTSPVDLDTLDVDGSFFLTHTAAEADDHAMEIVCDANNLGDVKAIDIDYITGSIGAGQDEEVILVNIDETEATGGDIVGYEMLATEPASGTPQLTGMLVGALIGPIEQLSGAFMDMDSALNKAVDVLAALSSGGAGNISGFVADNDTMTIGNAAKFEEMEWILDTGSSGAGISPTFEYSTGVGTWGTFTPADGTNGMRNTGLMAWLDSDIPSWAVGTGSEYLIRITRTRNNLGTTPIIDTVQIVEAVEFYWDKDGAIKSLKYESTQATGTAPFTVASTTVVTNLNADLLDGVQGSAYQLADGSRAWTGTGAGFRDEDDMSSNDATAAASQQSIKAYVDAAGGLSDVVDDTTPHLGGTLVGNGFGVQLESGFKLDFNTGSSANEYSIFKNGSSQVELRVNAGSFVPEIYYFGTAAFSSDGDADLGTTALPWDNLHLEEGGAISDISTTDDTHFLNYLHRDSGTISDGKGAGVKLGYTASGGSQNDLALWEAKYNDIAGNPFVVHRLGVEQNGTVKYLLNTDNLGRPMTGLLSEWNTSSTGPSNTTTETDVYDFGLDIGALYDATGRAIARIARCKMRGIGKQNRGGASDLTLRFKLGSTTMITSVESYTNDSTEFVWECEVELYGTAEDAESATMVFTSKEKKSNGLVEVLAGDGTATETTSSLLTATLTAQWGHASANTYLTLKHATFEMIGNNS